MQATATRMPPLTLTSPLSDYAGFKVTSYAIVFLPFLAHMDDMGMMERAILSAICGGAGTLLAIFGDSPKNTNDWIMRTVGGVVFTCLFGPYITLRLGFGEKIESTIMALGVVGLSSWYILGSVTKLLIAAQNSGTIAEAIKLWFRGIASLPQFQQQVVRVEKTVVEATLPEPPEASK